jgi:spore coat polysaccharide biosynthesis protein SpsF (cytidylyltransferase family)
VSIKSDSEFKYNRLTVDNEKDFIFAEKLMKKLMKKNNSFTYTDLLKIN